MVKKLIVSGCSYTDKNFTSIFHPELDTSWTKWPELLADKLEMECVNLGYCGSGNDYIYSSLLDYIVNTPKEEIGLVIAGWTRAVRRSYTENNIRFNLRWDTHGDMHYFILRSIRYYYSLQTICEKLNIPYKQIHILDPYESALGEERRNKPRNYTSKPDAIKTFMNNSYFNKIDDTHFIGWPVEPKLGGFSAWDKLEEKHFISELDRHPNAEGQQIIMETIYDRLG